MCKKASSRNDLLAAPQTSCLPCSFAVLKTKDAHHYYFSPVHMKHIARICLIVAALGGSFLMIPPAHGAELKFTGKLVCYLKRPVVLPVAADIISLNVEPGQKVTKGEVLGRYRLTPEALQTLRQRLLPSQIYDLRAKLAEVDKGLITLKNKKKTLTELSRQNLAPPQSLTQVNDNIQALTKERSALAEGLDQAEKTTQEQESLLRQQLGVPVKSGHIPQEGVLVAPIDGYVVWMYPDLRQGAEIAGTKPVMMVGVMDPMLLRAMVYESDAQNLKVGDEADITLESLPGRKFTARVSRLSWAPPVLSLEHPTYYDVEFKVANPDLVLKEGMQATIELPQRAGKTLPGASPENKTSSFKGPQGKK
jgi:macrolide-specific efflux system membrane fusion protein